MIPNPDGDIIWNLRDRISVVERHFQDRPESTDRLRRLKHALETLTTILSQKAST